MKIAFVILFSIFFVSWISLLLFWMRKNVKAKGWPIVKGVVEHSAASFAGRRRRSIIVNFWYQVDGTIYKSDRLRFGSQYQSHSRRFAKMILEKFEPGTDVDVHYDPENPSDAVLIPGIRVKDMAFIAFLFAFVSLMQYELIFS